MRENIYITTGWIWDSKLETLNKYITNLKNKQNKNNTLKNVIIEIVKNIPQSEQFT